MIKQWKWVCSKCSKSYLSETPAKRHPRIKHNGQGKMVRTARTAQEKHGSIPETVPQPQDATSLVAKYKAVVDAAKEAHQWIKDHGSAGALSGTPEEELIDRAFSQLDTALYNLGLLAKEAEDAR